MTEGFSGSAAARLSISSGGREPEVRAQSFAPKAAPDIPVPFPWTPAMIPAVSVPWLSPGAERSEHDARILSLRSGCPVSVPPLSASAIISPEPVYPFIYAPAALMSVPRLGESS